MARAAVRAKQAQQAQAQVQATVKPSRKQRRHAGGGNPNQDLFFMRLRRRQKWVFLGLAVIFAVSFAALGVGSGNGGGLEQVYKSILGSGDDPVGKAKDLIKTNPAKGYKDLANAYLTKNDLPSAISALESYLKIKKTDSQSWTLLGGYEKQQGDTYLAQYQQAIQTTQLQAPGSIVAPTGTLANVLGTNPIDQYYSQKNSSVSTPLYQQATAAFSSSLTAYQNAAKYAKGNDARAAAWYSVFSAAAYAGQKSIALKALQNYVKYNPTTDGLKQIEGICKKLGGSCVPKKTK